MAADKTEGPATDLSFLGIQLNAREMRTLLPPDKLDKLRTMVKELLGARVVKRQAAVGVIVGHLVHAATVFPLEKAVLNALFRADRTSQPGSLLRAGLVGPTARTLARLIGAPILAFKAARSAYIHRRSGILGLRCMVSATLVPGTVEQGVGLADNRPQTSGGGPQDHDQDPGQVVQHGLRTVY